MQRHEKHLGVERSRKDIFLNNLLGGIGWGIGIVLGATVVIGIIVLVLQQMSWVPIVGDTFLAISEYIVENSQYIPTK